MARKTCPNRGPLNTELAGNKIPATQCYVAGGDFRNGKNYFNPFLFKAEIERKWNFENLEAAYLWRHIYYITN
jgi:hypothetical protein